MGMLNQVLKFYDTVCHKVQFWDLYFFLIYINDFQNCLENSNLIMYADDTNVFIKEKNINTLYARAQNELINISKWLSANKLTLNINKVYNGYFKKKKTTSQ